MKYKSYIRDDQNGLSDVSQNPKRRVEKKLMMSHYKMAN